ncbi:MAG TPA: lysylphosphatidylglycerol synthase transmembrane domain-containing protein [Ilumatobacteraceae bacterium]
MNESAPALADESIDSIDVVSPRPRRRPIILLARIGLSLAMLYVLVKRMPHFSVDRLLPDWSRDTAIFLLLAIILTLAGIVLSTLRWRAVLNALGQDEKLGKLLSHNLAGLFVSNVLPTTIGGDVLRVSRLSKDNGETTTSFASVVLERLTGWLVLPVITLVGFMLNPGLRQLGSATEVAFALAVGTLLALTLLLVGVASRRFGSRVAGSDGWRRFAAAVHLGVARLRHHPAAAVNVLLTGFAYQLVLVLAALMAAKAVGISVAVGPTALLAFFPAVLIAQVLPISIAGLGVREGAFVLFLTPLGVPTEQAIALGLLLYLLNLGVSLLGAPAFAVGGRSRATLAA